MPLTFASQTDAVQEHHQSRIQLWLSFTYECISKKLKTTKKYEGSKDLKECDATQSQRSQCDTQASDGMDATSGKVCLNECE